MRPAQIFEAYCTKKSLARDHVRFLFDGARIQGTQTPAEVRSGADSEALGARTPRQTQLRCAPLRCTAGKHCCRAALRASVQAALQRRS